MIKTDPSGFVATMDYSGFKGTHNISKHSVDGKYQDFVRISYNDWIDTWPILKYHDEEAIVRLLGRTCHKRMNNLLPRVPWLYPPFTSTLTIIVIRKLTPNILVEVGCDWYIDKSRWVNLGKVEWILFSILFSSDNLTSLCLQIWCMLTRELGL